MNARETPRKEKKKASKAKESEVRGTKNEDSMKR